MLVDDLFDRLVHRLKRSRHEEPDELSLNPKKRKAGPHTSNGNERGSGFFNNASKFVVNHSTFIENRPQIVHNFVAGNPVLERIAPYANLDAAMDSSARFPPPLCHPGTRLKIGDRLFNWFVNPERDWDMIWLHGPAGTGKSAVAQTFAERCAKNGHLSASFFFSRLNHRNDPNTVIPSLVYQLAVCLPDYKHLVAAQLANDPELLRKARRTQFQKLIIEPFSQRQAQRRKHILEPILVILDGLDECKGEDAQREIIEMIGDVVRLKKDFPLVWMVCSRPEPHLKYIFSGSDFTVNCGRDELVIDAESIADVDFYLRDGLAGIKAEFKDVTTPVWPSEEQITSISQKASGHFGFASTSLRYIGDLTYAAPMGRLDALLSFLSGVRGGTSNPLAALDALYTGILRDVPDEVLPTTKQILCHIIVGVGFDLGSVQDQCNFLQIDQATFYSALRKLYSLVDMPSPEAAFERCLSFYHASFEDFLCNPSRSGKFAVDQGSAWLEYAKLCLSWYKIDLEFFHIADEPSFNNSHEHGILPGLRWSSDDTQEEISCAIARIAERECWWACSQVDEWDRALFSQIRNFDFRYIRADALGSDWCDFINKLWKDSSSNFIRTEPGSETDFQLLEYMESMIKSLWSSSPARFPLKKNYHGGGGDYFLLGYSLKAIVCWTTGYDSPMFGLLNCDKVLSEGQVDAYQAWLDKNGDVEGGSDIGDE